MVVANEALKSGLKAAKMRFGRGIEVLEEASRGTPILAVRPFKALISHVKLLLGTYLRLSLNKCLK